MHTEKNGNLEPAILSYGKEALRLNPKHTEAHNYIGIAYLKVGNIDKKVSSRKT